MNHNETSSTIINTTGEPSRITERNPKQKLNLTTFGKRGINEAQLWWRRFIQYVKKTHEIYLSVMTTDKEIKPEYREQHDAG